MNFFIEIYKNKNRFFTTLGLLILFLPFLKTCNGEKKTEEPVVNQSIDSLNKPLYLRDTIDDNIYNSKDYLLKKEPKIKLFDSSFISGYRVGYAGMGSFIGLFKEIYLKEFKWEEIKIYSPYFLFQFLIFVSILLYIVGFLQTYFKFKPFYKKFFYIEVFIIISLILAYYITLQDDLIFKKVLYGFWLYLINNTILVYYNYKILKEYKLENLKP